MHNTANFPSYGVYGRRILHLGTSKAAKTDVRDWLRDRASFRLEALVRSRAGRRMQSGNRCREEAQRIIQK